MFVLDEWQKAVLAAEGNICVCSGRQVGKSQIIAIKAAEFIVANPGRRVLIISVTEDQAEAMLQKIVLYLHECYSKLIATGKDKPTKHKVVLKNKSWVVTKAVGQYGLGVLGMTVDVVIPDECAYLPEAIWTSITPMLLTTGGSLWLLSTPNARSGFFWEAYSNPSLGFKVFHVSSEEVAESRSEPMRSNMLAYLAREKGRMSELEYAQQYLAQFLEELGQFFSDDLISGSQSLLRDSSSKSPSGEFYLGVDVARMGGDESTFEVLERLNGKYFHRENLVDRFTLTTDTVKKIVDLDKLYNFRKVYLDDGGLGAGVFDQLMLVDELKRKVVGINNASRALDKDASRTRKLLKEDLYLNLLSLLERKELELLKDEDVALSLKSVVCERAKNGSDVRIYGRYTHIVEGLIRAAWCSRDRSLDIYFERG